MDLSCWNNGFHGVPAWQTSCLGVLHLTAFLKKGSWRTNTTEWIIGVICYWREKVNPVLHYYVFYLCYSFINFKMCWALSMYCALATEHLSNQQTHQRPALQRCRLEGKTDSRETRKVHNRVVHLRVGGGKEKEASWIF